ncbi:MAG: AarF/ABC1/UbiB kinase family protein [Haliea sp.]|jgi:predicted unusual protein kinase regulating ubiquinone biosynthesis (AarF/ABC1/UbiB family)|nr:AarF/ABC1/UbiB kinase family protein [Haliea sp.]MBK6738392.1 AarF/ABC1/UbiB kinase family protein [Haliea sp.]
MAKKHRGMKGSGLPRTLSVSLAGLRAGSALAVDSVMQRVMGRGPDDEDSEFARREARRFVQELGKLKGTYIKIGQMLALFGDQFLPRVLVTALRDLSDQTEALHWDALESSVRDSLGERYAELDIDPQAIAAASLAQVHLARIRANGEWICLKLQYPGLRQVIDGDFDAVVRMLLLARWVKAGRELDDWLESMRAHLHNEIDYRREASYTLKMRALVAGVKHAAVRYHVPVLYPQYCSDSVLAMEFIEGVPVVDPDVAGLSLERRNALAKGMLELFFYEVYDWGLLQTDPNIGNYLLRLDDRRKKMAQDELVLLDFGSVLECPADFLGHLRRTIDAGQRQNVPELVAGLIGLGCLQADASEDGRKLFADFCLHLLEPLRPPAQLPAQYLNAKGEYRWGESQLMRRAGKQAAQSAVSRHFTTPSRDFALIARKLTGVFNFIVALDAEFNAHDMVQAHILRWRDRERRGA